MAAMISVIVPTRNQKMLNILLGSVVRNTVVPDELVILDNTDESNITIADSIMMEMRVRLKRCCGLSVNHMWNAGIEICTARSEHDSICILNDDIVLSPFYFDAARTLLSGHKDVSTFVPLTSTNNLKDIQINSMKGYGKSSLALKREGWAMAFRASVLKSISKIPHDRIPTFCGDDWLWYHTHKVGHNWLTSSECLCYHAVSSTIRPLGYMKKLKLEKNEFNALIKEMESACRD